MLKIALNKNWRMKRPAEKEYLPCGNLPVSVYQTLLDNEKMPNPYYGENEYICREISRDDYDFKTTFQADKALLSRERVILRLEGVDTISDIYLNNIYIGSTDNMFCIYEFDVKEKLTAGDNKLKISIKSPVRYIEKEQDKRPVWGQSMTMDGYPHIRKAHCMFGWDWGPQLPDMGIWRDIYLLGADCGRIDSIYAEQDFSDDYSALTLTVSAKIENFDNYDLQAEAEIITADGRMLTGVLTAGKAVFKLANPELWYPRGYGEQPLNTLTVRLVKDGAIVDESTEFIGFRKLDVHKNNEKGTFCFNCNGIDIFAMGANYIPLDQIFPYITKSRIHDFLQECLNANYNTLRIWGGGYYPEDEFLSECDRLGIILWQDFMFACSSYRLSEKLEATIKAEIRDNIKRMRNHPCIALWCGNNEVESMWEGWGIPEDKEAQADYVKLFEQIIPDAVQKYDPQRFYWPSSPSSGGNQFGEEGVFRGSSDNHRGDQHYWDIWHNFKPIGDFRKYLFPFCSEYGFESIPCMKTIRTFAEEKDLNICGPVMEAHQKCTAGNEKLLYYIAQMCRYPYSFDKLIYASQLVQSDCIRSNVEHMRRNRGKCMGSLYWQVNDSNPVISWSSLDYYSRPKALHFAAKKFYAPVLLSCLEEDTSAVILNVSNEKTETVKAEIIWKLRNEQAEVLTEGKIDISVSPLSSKNAAALNFSDYFLTEQDKRTKYLEYSLWEKGNNISCGTTIFVRPKTFCFADPEINVHVDEKYDRFEMKLTAKAYAKSVCLDLISADCVFSDNWFDINGNEEKKVVVYKNQISEELGHEQFCSQLTVTSCYDLQ